MNATNITHTDSLVSAQFMGGVEPTASGNMPMLSSTNYTSNTRHAMAFQSSALMPMT